MANQRRGYIVKRFTRGFPSLPCKMAKLIAKGEESAILEIDKDVKNKFRWAWLDKSVTLTVKIGKKDETITEKVGDYIGKCAVPGKAQCLYCLDLIAYGSRGCVALIEHAKGRKHCEKVTLRRSNYSLGSAFKIAGLVDTQSQIAPPATPTATSESKPLVPLGDRVINSEDKGSHCLALVLGVIAEHSLPLSMAPVILDTARELAKDPKALNHMRLERTTASYKMRFGLAKTFLDETLDAMRNTPFSLNIDESTSNSDKRVLAMLASYYSYERGMIVVDHLSSLEVVRVDAESLHQELVSFFQTHNIPWSNCVSILMDSCSVMRGSKSGLETRIRSGNAPQLLDVDGDSCHHIHNACKQFCAPFGNWVEYLQSDIHNDMKWSPDLKQYFQEMCHILGIKYTMPERFLNHRWLSCYDACLNNIMMMDALKTFYYSFLEKEDQGLYKEPARLLLSERNVSLSGIERIKAIWKQLSSKKLTDDGKKRKQRIADKLIIHSKKTMLIMNFYLSVLPILKEYVCLFQSREPLIHLLHDKQQQVFLDFLACFLKPEVLASKSAKGLQQLDLQSDEGKFLDVQQMFVGKKAKDIIRSSHKNDKVTNMFLTNASAAYMKCAMHMQKRLPLTNALLRSMSSIDPEARGHSETAKALDSLGSHLEPFLSEEEQESLSLEIRRFQVDKLIPQPVIGERVDAWWTPIIKSGKYPALSKVVVVCLSCFHGPMVESSFNTMGDVIDIRSTRMRTSTYSAMQTVRYSLKSRATSALELYKKGDIKHDKVSGRLVRNFKSSCSSYVKEKEALKKEMDERLAVMQVRKQKLISRAAEKRVQEKSAKVAKLAHERAQKRKAVQQRLEALVKKRKLLQ